MLNDNIEKYLGIFRYSLACLTIQTCSLSSLIVSLPYPGVSLQIPIAEAINRKGQVAPHNSPPFDLFSNLTMPSNQSLIND